MFASHLRHAAEAPQHRLLDRYDPRPFAKTLDSHRNNFPGLFHHKKRDRNV
jgi:hypothetical protein